MKITLGRLIALPIVVVLTALVSVTLVVQLIGAKINKQTLTVQEESVPKALMALSMLEEVGDMNSNVLEYVVGETDEVEPFEDNYEEFKSFLANYRSIVGKDDETAAELARLAESYYNSAKKRVFSVYDPEAEANALKEANRLTSDVGAPMENILDKLKELEVADAGSSGNLDEIVKDDLPGVQYYLELVDEAGDMISSLNAYMRGEASAAESFEKDAHTFDKYFALLRPLETRRSEVEQLDRVAELYADLLKGGRAIFASFDPVAKKAAITAIDQMEHSLFSKLEKRLDNLAETAKLEEETGLAKLRDSVSLLGTAAWLSLVVSLVIGVGFLFGINRALTRPLVGLTEAMNGLSSGKLDVEISSRTRNDEVGEMANAVQVFKQNAVEKERLEIERKELERVAAEEAEAAAAAQAEVQRALEAEKDKLLEEDWLKTGIAAISEAVQQTKTPQEFAEALLSKLAEAIDAQIGAFYLREGLDDDTLLFKEGEAEYTLLASYAFTKRKGIETRYKEGESLVGQAAKERKTIVVSEIPDDYIAINSGTGKSTPKNIIVTPITYEGQVMGIIEIGLLKGLTGKYQEFIEQVLLRTGVILNIIIGRLRTESLLETSRKQAEVLSDRERDLKQANIEMEYTAEMAQQASRTKSEFLANMSHELRTPLNSLLILAQDLTENEEGNLTEAQIEDSRIILNSGKDLLTLINDVPRPLQGRSRSDEGQD